MLMTQSGYLQFLNDDEKRTTLLSYFIYTSVYKFELTRVAQRPGLDKIQLDGNYSDHRHKTNEMQFASDQKCNKQFARI